MRQNKSHTRRKIHRMIHGGGRMRKKDFCDRSPGYRTRQSQPDRHRCNNLLMAALGYIELAIDDPAGPPRREFLIKAKQAMKQASACLLERRKT